MDIGTPYASRPHPEVSVHMMKRIFLFLAIAAGTASAQVDTGVITGTVHDQAGAVLPEAKVVFTDEAAGVSLNATTGPQGNFASPPLKPGSYSVTVQANGFKSQTLNGIRLQVQDRLSFDFKMSIGAVDQNVVVTDESPTLQTETSSLGQVISSETMTELPLNGRDYLQLATLSTGVVGTSSGTNGNSGGSSTGGLDSFAANGARGTLNNFLLDGIDNNSNDNGGVVLRTNVDAIQEFKVQTNGYSAQFGRSGGAVINAVVKSGTNKLHGDAFEFFRNSVLDAKGYFESPTAKKASFKQNQYGGVLGGPIIKDKLFWFGDYQGTSVRTPVTWISTVPTAAERAGDFSDPAIGTIYDPATYDVATGSRNPFPDNVIPADRIDALAQRYVNLYPLPNQPGLSNNYRITPIQPDHVDQGDFRSDYDPSQVDQAFFRWSMSGRTYSVPAPLPGRANGGGSFTGTDSENTMGAALGETHTFTPNTINSFHIGFNWVGIKRGVPEGGNVAPPAELQVPGVIDNPGTSGLTLFVPSGYRRVGDPGYAPTILSSEERQITDALNLVRGKHTIAVGGEMRWSQYNIFQVPAPNGRFSFSGQFTQDPLTSDGGNGIADELLGLPIQSVINSQVKVRDRQRVPSAFAQDDYKVSKTLTLNVGLRYDYFSPLVSANDQQANFDYKTGTLIVAGKDGASRGLVTPDHFNFAPRVGFAKTFGKTVLSSAYGIFWSGQEIRTAAPLQLAYNLPFYYQPTFSSDGVTPVLTVSGGFPDMSPSNAPNSGVTSVDQRLKTPYYQEWNLSVQQPLPSQITLQISYAASKGTHLQSLADYNQVKVPGPGDIQSRRPYPQYGPFASIENRGNSNYHSMQVRTEKRYSNGLYLLSSFTWSKAMNDQPEICCNQPYAQNSWNIPADKGLADFNQALRWVLSYDYAIPLGRGHRFAAGRAANLVIGGWHFDGIYTLGSGFPFSAQIGYDPSNTGSQGLLRPDQIADGNMSSDKRSPDQWFNVDAFALPAQYTFGNARRNNLIGPGINNLDGSLRKLFAMGENSLEFRLEFFNLANHPNFAQPDPYITDGPGQAGVITDTSLPNREIQLGLRYRF